MKAEVYYKGSLIKTLSEGQSMTLHCGGAKLTDDIVVRAVADDTNVSYTLDGYWMLKSTPTKPLAEFSEDVAFISNSTNYLRISYDGTYLKYNETRSFHGNSYSDTLVYTEKSEYKYVRFISPQTVSKEFYEWFTTNATNKTITFTIDGTVYQSFEDDFWYTWTGCDFNTIGAYEKTDGTEEYYITIKSGSSFFIVTDDADNSVHPMDDSIIANKAYVTKEHDFSDDATHSGGAN